MRYEFNAVFKVLDIHGNVLSEEVLHCNERTKDDMLSDFECFLEDL